MAQVSGLLSTSRGLSVRPEEETPQLEVQLLEMSKEEIVLLGISEEEMVLLLREPGASKKGVT